MTTTPSKINPVRVALLVSLFFACVYCMYILVPTKPHLNVASREARSNGREIYRTLVAFANSHDKVFPSKSPSDEPAQYSNDVLRNLFVMDLTNDERLFYVPSHPAHEGQKPDDEIGNAENSYREALAAGENAWAYFPGLTLDRHPASTPLLRTVVSGRYEVIVTVGGSVKIIQQEKVSPIPTEPGWLLPAPAKRK